MKRNIREELVPEAGDTIFIAPRIRDGAVTDEGGVFKIKALTGFCSCCELSVYVEVEGGITWHSHGYIIPVDELNWSDEIQRWELLDRSWH